MGFLTRLLKKGIDKDDLFAIIKKSRLISVWDLSSAGRASALQAEGHRFEPYRSHSGFSFGKSLLYMSGRKSWQIGWRDSSVGKSTRFIPVVSLVQIQFPLLWSVGLSRRFFYFLLKLLLHRARISFAESWKRRVISTLFYRSTPIMTVRRIVLAFHLFVCYSKIRTHSNMNGK